MKPFLILTSVGLLMTSCKSGPDPSIVALSEAIKFSAVCGVIGSLIWGITLVAREYIRKGK